MFDLRSLNEGVGRLRLPEPVRTLQIVNRSEHRAERWSYARTSFRAVVEERPRIRLIRTGPAMGYGSPLPMEEEFRLSFPYVIHVMAGSLKSVIDGKPPRGRFLGSSCSHHAYFANERIADKDDWLLRPQLPNIASHPGMTSYPYSVMINCRVCQSKGSRVAVYHGEDQLLRYVSDTVSSFWSSPFTESGWPGNGKSYTSGPHRSFRGWQRKTERNPAKAAFAKWRPVATLGKVLSVFRFI